ncbi:beta-1,3-N-acetylglucosaminyltransferase radical fringe-like [Pollicipes pollicipes]|uniref:beta-1,3-N-acetylglucosaminyltransferase radical fringe-like n=1 Tax=Pollicipes pollicipes TaxID=41117 RepID=UPI001884B791|nr:beta-1,3-N-acetylglucosaminyltransferase radical fringe-like [Pollicipes pollicipes]XP_037089099.1 beta-1,3-N-acetylglucosaminyltransferase radical fringe-like [Pollicipes pollicipes]XP_037089100.1 beta-1,3-N-acetylglucosaminyltransferase radical fringe-like [Pollicipes pollicipes]
MRRCGRALRRWLTVGAGLLLVVGLALLWLGARAPAGADGVSAPTTQSSAAPLAAGGSALLAVRTAGQLHDSRLPVLARSWLQDVRPTQQVVLFSDVDSVTAIAKKLDGVGAEVSRCGQAHTHSVLCCRLAHEISVFLTTKHGWLCHFDDDNYVNTAALDAMLVSYNARQAWYLGRQHSATYRPAGQTAPLRFATGGAGFCISRAALLLAAKGLVGGQLESSCLRLGMPDDVALGFILWTSHRVRLTHINEFHSHLEQLSSIPTDSLQHQISLSYSLERRPPNTVSVAGLDTQLDPTRFRSLHCMLHGSERCT